jgi:2'-5' RNA ligase
MIQKSPLILTLQLDGASARYFNELRQQYFPPALNVLPAHVTLFHHLTGDRIDELMTDLEGIVSGYGSLDIQVSRVRSLGRGVAYDLQSEQLSALRGRLAHSWSAWLTAQDRQPFKAHITVQNKVHPDEARRTLAVLAAVFTPHAIGGVGLDLWRYLGGPWEHVREFLFR